MALCVEWQPGCDRAHIVSDGIPVYKAHKLRTIDMAGKDRHRT